MIAISNKDVRDIQPLPFGVYFWTVVALTFIGLADSVYLSISHYRIYTDVGYESFCAISRAINCDTVSQSPYAVFMSMPVPVWGVVGYVFFLLVLMMAGNASARNNRLWSILLVISLIYSLYSIILAVISHVYINSYCIMCILVYAINFLLVYFCWLIRRRFDSQPFTVSFRKDLKFLWQYRLKAASVFVPLLAGSLFLWAVFPAYWNFQPSVLAASPSTGLTVEGHPWIGAEDPELVITEFTDYLCFQCSKMNYYIRKLMARYPGKIRVVHRHFPMDHTVNPTVGRPVHTGAGALALLAIHAETEGKFWLANDYLFANARINDRVDLQAMADAIGLDFAKLSRAPGAEKYRLKLQKDIADGLKLGVSGTPTYIINGRLYDGQIPSDILSRIDD